MSINWKPVVLPKSGPFDLRVEFYDEQDISMRKHFMDECGWSEQEYNEIKNFKWLRIEVIASYNGTDYGTAHLGCCCYKNKADFMGTDIDSMASGYMPQLIEEAVSEAKESAHREHDKLNDQILDVSGLILAISKAGM